MPRYVFYYGWLPNSPLMWRSKERRDHRYFLTLQLQLLLQGEDHAALTVAARVHFEKLVSFSLLCMLFDAHLASKIWKGQLAAWSQDLSKTQAMISHRYGPNSLGQGFDNEVIGRLLCPVGSDWHNDR
jgi:hypothetical protein